MSVSRKRFHGSDEDGSIESSSESNDSIEMPKRKKKFRKGGKKLRLSESKGAASIVLSETKSERDRDIGDFGPRLRRTGKKSVRFHPSSEFLDKKTKEYRKGKERLKKRTEAKRTRNRDTDDSTDDDASDPENIILFKSMKSVIVGTEDGEFKMVKVLVEDEHFWNDYNCYAYERNGGVVIRFYTLRQ